MGVIALTLKLSDLPNNSMAKIKTKTTDAKRTEGSLHRDCCAARRAQKILREITRSVKLKKRMVSKLGMTPQQASAECGDEIY